MAWDRDVYFNTDSFWIGNNSKKSYFSSVRLVRNSVENIVEICPTTTTIEITTLQADDSSFELTPTCDEATKLQAEYFNL